MKFQLFVSLMLAASSLALVAPGSADHDLSKRSPQTLSHTAALTSRYESPRGQSSCQDQEKIDACQARGPEWSCDGNCKCQGPPKECHDDDKWKICLGQGKHAGELRCHVMTSILDSHPLAPFFTVLSVR